MQHAWQGIPLPQSSVARMDAACSARDAIAHVFRCTYGCSMLGTRCHRYDHGLHARTQHAKYEMPSLRYSVAYTDATCLARRPSLSPSAARSDAAWSARAAIAMLLGCTHGCSMLGTGCHRHACGLHAWLQHAWHGMPSLYLWPAHVDSASTTMGCASGCSMLGTGCHHCTCVLHARRQQAWHEMPSLRCWAHARMQHARHKLPSPQSWAARSGAASLARDAINTFFSCTHGCSMLGTRCHRYYYLRLHARMQHAWHKMPSPCL